MNDPEMLAETERNHALREAQAYLWTVKRHMRWQEQRGAKISVTDSVTISADIAQALIECAEPEKSEDAQRYDLIAMTTHGRGGLARWIMGSITERVLTTTRLPMLIVHPHQQS